jgi:hypothetical protein
MAWVLVVLLLLAGCGVSTPHRTIALAFDGHAPTSLGHDPDEVRIAQVVAQLMRDRLDMPFPEGTTIRVYVNQATFAEGLAQDGGHVSDDAWDRSRVAAALASPHGLFVRGDIVNGMRLLDKVGLIGIARLSEFNRRFSRNEDPRSHWSQVFPIRYSEFLTEFRARLEQLGG